MIQATYVTDARANRLKALEILRIKQSRGLSHRHASRVDGISNIFLRGSLA